MNNDDTFKNSNNNNPTPVGLTPELEVRVVAWVLGEATPAEAVELARMAAENSALADFKRRIEAVHGLVGAAARPVNDGALRLSDERRVKVLAVIGEDAAGRDEPEKDGVRTTPRWVQVWNKWALPMAACITLCVLLGAVLFPAIGAAKKAAYRGVERKLMFNAAPVRPDPSNTLLGPSGSPEMPADRVTPTDVPMVAFAAKSAAPGRAAWSAGAGDNFAEVNAPVAAPAARPEGSITLGGANSYAGGTAVTGGTLAIDALEQPQLLTKAGSGQLAVDKSQFSDANKEMASADGFAASAPAAPASPAASRGDMLVLNSYASSSYVTTDADRTENKSDVGRFNRSGGKDQGGAMGGYLANDEVPPPSAPTAVEKRQTVTITAGTPQEFEVRDVAVSKQLPVAQDRAQPLSEVTVSWQRTGVYRNISNKNAEQTNKALEEDARVAHQPARPAFDESLRVETATSQQAISTFSLHVSDASFRIVKAALARGEAPDPASIRPEEFYNAFDYGDPSAVAGEPVACRIEQSAHPFLQQRNLVRIAMKVPATGRGNGQPLRLTVLLDTSGSMEREDRAAGVRAALTSLVSLLGADDRITLIGFARQPHLLADRVPGNQAAGLADLVAKTPFEGGTNLEEALKLAGNLARGQFTASAQNRIVLLTDGAANLGNDDPVQLADMIAALRQQGIAFDACGVGADGLDDTILEALTRKGDGRYTVINSPEEADAGFAKKLAGAFRPAAENVKVQVRFNPSRVAHYRLIGFEQHRLKTEDFRNDRVDAAELAAEEAAVALYQVEVIPDGEGELGEVFVRFRDAATGNMVERSWTLSYAPQPAAFVRATPSMKLAGTAAFLAEKLRGGDLAAQIRLDEFAPVVNALRGDYAHDARVQDLVTMFAQARRLTGE